MVLLVMLTLRYCISDYVAGRRPCAECAVKFQSLPPDPNTTFDLSAIYASTPRSHRWYGPDRLSGAPSSLVEGSVGPLRL